MSAIEERIVSMKFQGDQFLAGIDKSLSKLDQLNTKLKSQEGVKGLDSIGAAAGRQTSALGKIASGVENISGKFKAMSVVGLTALSALSSQAIFAGQNLLKNLSFGPILDGFHEYETNLNSIQTILSNTTASGAKLSDVSAALNELNHYSDQTIYNFSEMARNIGTFTAAGVGLKPAVAAIKGIANLAALSGSNSQQASTAMYQLSQAISSGRVSLEDWNSVVNAGMGGTVFQRALAQNAEKMGTLKDNAVKLLGPMKNVSINGKSFRDSITAKPGEKSWLTSDVLTKTLAQFTGDLTDAQLKAEGFNASEIKAIQAQAKMAKNAATQVKTLTQLLGTISESVGSGWTTTWQTIFGDFPEAKSLFTNVNNVLGTFVQNSANARNKVLGDWKALGGRTAIINAIANSFKALIAFVKPIGQAFREIFPATTGAQLASMSKSIESFTKNLTISGTTANNLKRTFAGFFAILDIGWQIIKKVVSTFFELIGIATDGSGGFLNFTGTIGDFLVGIDKAIKSGEGLGHVFDIIKTVIAAPIKLIKVLAGYLGSLFDGFNGAAAAKNIAEFTSKLDPLGKLGVVIGTVWGHAVVIFQNVWKSIQSLGRGFQKVFGGLGDQITNALTGMNFEDFLHTINTGLFGAIVLLIKSFINHLKGGGAFGGFIDTFKDGVESITGALSSMQHALQAATLLQIAAAIGIIAVSMNILAKIDAAGLARASAAITVMFAQLMGSMIAFQKISGFAGFAKMPFVAGSLILLAAAVVILAQAVKQLSGLDWNELAKGLTGLAGILAAVVGTMTLMPNPKGIISTGLGLLVLAAGIKVLVSAVSDLGNMSWEEIGKGLVGVGALLGALTLFTKFAAADKGGLLQGAGLLLLAAGIKVLASAVTEMAGLSWMEIARGLVTMAGGMAIMVAGLALIPPTAPLAAAGVLIVALSLSKVADALQAMAGMSWGEILKGLVTMLGALTIIAAALIVIPPTAALGAAGVLVVALSLGMIGAALQTFSQFSWGEILKAVLVLGASLAIISIAMDSMVAALPGAAALLVVAASLAILAPVLVVLGAMTWGEIAKGLTTLALALTVIGVAAALLTPVIPSLIGLGAGIALLGAAMALAGAGVFLFGAGLTLLAASGVAAAAALVGMITILIGAVPKIVDLVGALLVSLLDLVINTAPKIGQAMTALIGTMISVISKLSPKITALFVQLVGTALNALVKNVPNFTDAGYRIITGFINGIAKRISGVVTAATNLVVAFIGGISKNAPRVIDAGVKLVINLVNGLANAIRSNTGAMQAAGRNLASAIIDGMTGGLASGVGRIASMARNVASTALNAAKSVLGIHSPSKEFEKIGKYVVDGFVKGLDGNKSQINDAFNSLRGQLYEATKDSAKQVDDLTAKLKKLQSARHKDNAEIAQTKAALAQANKEYKNEVAAWNEMRFKLTDEQVLLGKLADKYDALSESLKAATDTYDAAIKTRDDYNKTITDQYGALQQATGDTTAESFISDLKKQLEDTKSFMNTLQQLRALGLNDDLYKQLLQTGSSALPFVQDLLADGKTSIDQINDLDKQLGSVASSLGQTASSQLYQAAVDSAKGLVDGLAAQQAAIEAQMDKIATAMVASIKKKLGIKSPSRVFAEVGAFSSQGLADGLKSKMGVVTDSAQAVGDKAVEAMRISLSDVSKMVADNIDVQPTIRPVLDLTDIQKNAGKIAGLLPASNKMRIDGTVTEASSVASAIRNRLEGDDPSDPTSGAPILSYTQNNYSPKALSPVDIYRGTKNQLSTVKGALST